MLGLHGEAVYSENVRDRAPRCVNRRGERSAGSAAARRRLQHVLGRGFDDDEVGVGFEPLQDGAADVVGALVPALGGEHIDAGQLDQGHAGFSGG